MLILILVLAAACICLCVTCVILLQKKIVLLRMYTEQIAELEQQLIQQTTLLEEQQKASLEEMQSFNSNISHSMRVPISVILGYADLLKGDLINDEAVRREYFAKLCVKVNYLAEVLEQLFLESRTKHNSQQLVQEQIDLLALVNSSVEDTQPTARLKNILIRVESQELCVPVVGDVVKLTKVFYNIIENSIKYMNRGGTITITVSHLQNKDGNSEAFLVFKDDGEGVDQADTEKLFELNYQGVNKQNGSGFGLYMVRTIINAHGGTVFAKSGKGHGFTVYISLPAKNVESKN